MAVSAPIFAKKLQEALKPMLEKEGYSQSKLAKDAKIPLVSFHRIYRHGIGSEEHICAILINILHLKKRRILEMLASRRSELSNGKAKSSWADFAYAFVDEEDYLSDMCPLPLEKAYACTNLDIEINELISFAEENGIKDIRNMKEIQPYSIYSFIQKAQQIFGEEIIRDIFINKKDKYAPVINLNFSDVCNTNKYLPLHNCNGKVLLGLPHLLLADYSFDKGGIIHEHDHSEGVEMLYSVAGKYNVKCNGKECKKILSPQKSLFIYKASYKHEIRIIDEAPGRLIMARFYPTKRNQRPGP